MLLSKIVKSGEGLVFLKKMNEQQHKELKVVSDVTSRLGGMKVSDPVKVQTIFDLPNPDDKVENPVAEALKELNETLKTIRNIMQKLSN